MFLFIIQIFPLAESDAVVVGLHDASVDVRVECEAIEAAELNQAVICALIEAIAVRLVWHVKLRIFLSTLSLHLIAINFWCVRFLALRDRED